MCLSLILALLRGGTLARAAALRSVVTLFDELGRHVRGLRG
ncbi:hypothetical protein [Pseudomonas paralactis]